jgi:hypothetical protein
MANTTYFGWETPDDTDLVKDGAAAIRTLGQAIDTSMQDLEGGTTGQILSKNSNTDMDFVWITNDVGDITEVVAGTGLSGGGSSGSVTLTNTVATEFDAKGDLVVGTGSDTFDKLTVGANDTILVADSSTTTGLKWATPASGGGMTLLSTTTLSSATTTISVGSGYIDLVLHFTGIYLPSASQGLEIRYNTVSSGYNSVFLYQSSGGASVENNNNQNGVGTAGVALTDANNQYLFGYMRFFDYEGTAGMKSYQGQIAARTDSEAYFGRTFFGANSATPAAITQVQFVTGAASFSGGTVKVYGVK